MPKPYTPNDKWSQRAAKEGFRARSVYKLMDLDERFGLLKPGMVVLDLGAAPGSWLQYTSKKIGPKGKIIGVDLQRIESVADNVKTYQADILDNGSIENILKGEGITLIDCVLSDLAPSTSGVHDVDQWKSIELSQATVALALKHLKPHGICILKILRGADFEPFIRELKNTWDEVRQVSVEASRDRSTEIYVIMKKMDN